MLSLEKSLLVAVALSAAILPRTAGATVGLPADFVDEVIVSGLAQPNSMAFIPDGRLLFTEQYTTKIRLLVGGHISAVDPILRVPGVRADDYEQGLQGIAVDPGWPTRPYVYVYYNRRNSSGGPAGYCRLVRYTASGEIADALGDSIALGDSLLLIDDIPDYTIYHQAGCLRFGPDGYLYVSVGDDDVNPCVAADSTSLRGEILRLDVSLLPAGPGPQVDRALLAPPNNPLSSTNPNARLVWAFGLRNPWRFHIDPYNGKIYTVDVGEADFEEMSEVLPGDFMGWPWREGLLIMERGNCPEPGGEGTFPYRHPIVSFGRGAQLTAIFSGGIYRPVVGGIRNWPFDYDGSVFYGEYYSGVLRQLRNIQGMWVPAAPVDGQPTATEWGTGFSSAVDFLTAPDGSVLWLRQFNDSWDLESGSIHRIRYTGETSSVDQRPSRILSLMARPNPSSGRVELVFRLTTPADVELALYDLSGRLVRTLWDGIAPAEETQVAWDGTDRDGRLVRQGVYMARLTHGGTVKTTRVLRLR